MQEICSTLSHLCWGGNMNSVLSSEMRQQVWGYVLTSNRSATFSNKIWLAGGMNGLSRWLSTSVLANRFALTQQRSTLMLVQAAHNLSAKRKWLAGLTPTHIVYAQDLTVLAFPMLGS